MDTPKKIQNKLHLYLGRVILVVALVNVFAGLVLLGTGMAYIAGYGILILVQVGVILYLEVRLRSKKMSAGFQAASVQLEEEVEDDDL